MRKDSHRSERFWQHLEPLQGALEAYCRRCLDSVDDVEDILQETVVAALRDFGEFAEGTNFRAWIFRYLNLTILAANRRSRKKPHISLDEDLPTVNDNTPSFIETESRDLIESLECLLEQCDELLSSAISRLNWLERSSLLLKSLGQFRYREIAEILELPMGTVMSALSRARLKLRQGLVEYARDHRLLRPGDGAITGPELRGGR